MFNWYKDSSVPETRTFWACYMGWSLDAMDFMLLAYVLPALIGVWHISKFQGGLLQSATLLAGAFGGWGAGALSDRYGRVKTLQIMVAWFSVTTVLCAFAQNYPQLIVLKTLQGFGFGGEWATGAVLMAEIIRPQNRGRALGWIQSGWAVGWGTALVLSTIVFTYLPHDIAWRALFAVGILPAFLIIYVRRNLVEPPRAPMSPAVVKQSAFADLFAIFKPEVLRSTLVGGLFGVGAHGGYAALTTFLPTYLRNEHHLTIMKSGAYMAVIILAFFFGCIVSGTISDWLGRRLNAAIFAIACIITVLLYTFASPTNNEMLILGFPLGFFAAGIPASMAALFSEMYPVGIRGTGTGFCYNFGRVVAAGFPALVGFTAKSQGLGAAIGIDTALAYALVLVAVLLLPESRQKVLIQEPAAANA